MRLIDRLPRPWSARRQPLATPSRVGRPATDLHGTGPDGAPVSVAVGTGQTVLFFLTTSCLGCRVIWEGLAARAKVGPVGARGGPRVVLVTPDPSTESTRTVAALAPKGVPVVMSSASWHAYEVTGAPWCVVVAGGVVKSYSPAPPDLNDAMTLLGGPDGN